MMYRITVVQWDDNSTNPYPPTQTVLDIRRKMDPCSSIISALAWENDNQEIPVPSWDPELSKED